MTTFLRLVPGWMWLTLAVLAAIGIQEYRIHGLQVDLQDMIDDRDKQKKRGDDEGLKAAQCLLSNQNKDGLIDKNNEWIRNHEELTKARLEEADKRLAEAEEERRKAEGRMQKILSERPPQNVDKCTAASAAFEAQLREERAQ